MRHIQALNFFLPVILNIDIIVWLAEGNVEQDAFCSGELAAVTTTMIDLLTNLQASDGFNIKKPTCPDF